MPKHDICYSSPLYLQLREIIRSRIENGEYLPGMAIPSENELAEHYGLNRLTVRNAIDALVNEGMLKRVQGSGAYVMGEKIERDLDTLGSFKQTMLDKHYKPSTRILQFTQRSAGLKYAHLLNISSDEPLYYIQRVDRVNEEPVSIEEIYVRKSIVPVLEKVNLSHFSMYEIYGFYNVHPKYAQQTLDLVKLEKNYARILHVAPETAVMLFTCISYDENDCSIEYSRTYTRSDKCIYTVNFCK